MKKYLIKAILVIVWGGLLIFLYRQGYITADMRKLRGLFGNSTVAMVGMFFFMAVGRVIFFIPGIVFMVLGGLCFGPVWGFFLSMLSIIVTETVIFLAGKYLAGERVNRYLKRKYRPFVRLTEKYGYDLLTLGIICPLAPTDVVCLAAGILHFQYKRYILTVIMANVPMMAIYCYLGNSRLRLVTEDLVLISVVGLVLAYTLSIWKQLKLEEGITG